MRFTPRLALTSLLTAWTLCLPLCVSTAESDARRSVGRGAAIERFKDYKLGLFIHWAPWVDEALRPGETWADRARHVTEHYAPAEFNEREWLDVAEAMGARYITFTVMHEGALGFSLWDTRTSPFSSVRAPGKTDYVALLTRESQRRGMPLFLYYGLWDWIVAGDPRIPDARVKDPKNWDRYIAYYQEQVRELASSYGPLAGFWFDPGLNIGPEVDYRFESTAALIRRLQPGALISGRDFCESRGSGDAATAVIVRLNGRGVPVEAPIPPPREVDCPFEVIDTLNDTWNYSSGHVKPLRDLLRKLVIVTGRGGNYLLNIGPMPSGRMDPEQVKRLREIGSWLRMRGETIYGTRPGPFGPGTWGYPVSKDDRIFLHVLQWPGKTLSVPLPKDAIRSATTIRGVPLKISASGEGTLIELSNSIRDEIDTVIVLKLHGTKRHS
jgi:alpha-L-fucosidase